MTYQVQDSPYSFLPTSEVFPEDDKQFLEKMNNVYVDISKNVNSRELARYELVEQVTGQQFFDPANAQLRRYSYRKCFSFGAVASGATLLIPHGITGMTMFTRIYGTCIDTTVYYKPIPYVSMTSINYNIDLKLDSTNIIIINGVNGAPAAPALTSGLIVLEYLKT